MSELLGLRVPLLDRRAREPEAPSQQVGYHAREKHVEEGEGQHPNLARAAGQDLGLPDPPEERGDVRREAVAEVREEHAGPATAA